MGEREEWPFRRCLEVFGLKLGLGSNVSTGLEMLDSVRLPGWEIGPDRQPLDSHYGLVLEPGGQYRLEHDEDCLCQSDDPVRILEVLEDSVHSWLAQRALGKVFVHAGAVAWKGRALIFPGRSYSGKSTLTMALLQAGAQLYSDEFAVLDSQGFVHPFARAVKLRATPTASQRTLSLPGASEPAPAGLILLTRHRAGARFRPRRLSEARALVGILEHTVAARLNPQECLATLAGLVRTTPVLSGVRAEAAGAARSLLRLLEGDFGGNAPEPGKAGAVHGLLPDPG